jgi:hypothetical protein
VYLLFADGRVESVSADKLAESLRASDLHRAEWEASRPSPPTSRPAK